VNTNDLTINKTTDTCIAEQALSVSGKAISRVCQCVCNCLSELEEQEKPTSKSHKKRLQKIMAMYATMVVVSTCAIFWLEHASIISAFRTALVAAIGKTFAAHWVSSFFE
jgi:uncharacterized membrane protein